MSKKQTAKRPRGVPDGRRPRPAGGLKRAAAARPAAKTPSGRRHQGKAEEMFHGVRACEALFARRPEAIVRVYVSEPRRRQFAKLLEWCARERKGFQVVGDDNLAKLTGSIHHEGMAILAKAIPRWTLEDVLRHMAAGTPSR